MLDSVLSSDFVPENLQSPVGRLLPTTNVSESFRTPHAAPCKKSLAYSLNMTQMISFLSILSFLCFSSHVSKGHEFLMLRNKKINKNEGRVQKLRIALVFQNW